MIIVTTDGAVEVWAQTTSSLDRVVLASKRLETLQGVSASIELAGVSEDDKDVCGYNQYLRFGPDKWILELDRTTFKLWLNFETDGYLRYGKNEFEDAVTEEDHRKTVQEIRKVIYDD